MERGTGGKSKANKQGGGRAGAEPAADVETVVAERKGHKEGIPLHSHSIDLTHTVSAVHGAQRDGLKDGYL